MNLHPDIAAVLEGRSQWAVVTGDCLSVLPTLPAGCVDAVVTDPPFGVRDEDWDRIDEREFCRVCMGWLSVASLVSRELLVFGTSGGPMHSLCSMLYQRVRTLIWNKPIGSQYAGASERGMWFAHEAIYHCHSGRSSAGAAAVAQLIREARERASLSRGAVDNAVRGRRTGLCYRWEEAMCLPSSEDVPVLKSLLSLDDVFESAISEANGRNARAAASDVFTHRTVTSGAHPCEKPLGLMSDLIAAVTDSGSIILDPFCGSGTTGVACIQTGRRFIGIEIDEKYAAIARRRIADAAPLFVPPPTPAPAELFGGGA